MVDLNKCPKASFGQMSIVITLANISFNKAMKYVLKTGQITQETLAAHQQGTNAAHICDYEENQEGKAMVLYY